MAGQKTHDQQQRIIKGEVSTKGGGPDFPAEEDLKSSKALRDAKAKGDKLAEPLKDLSDADDRNMVRGRNHERRQ